jgi:conjugal transfer pilus assembly protein TraW
VGTLILFPFEMAFAIDLGVVGKTYPIAERDASEELKERVRSVNWQKLLAENGIERMKKYKPDTVKSLPRATEDSVRMVSMDYTLEFDITDGKGNIIYPKGYTFNPLDFMTYTRTVVVLNGADRDQVEWFKKSPYYKKSNVMVLIADGNYYDLSGELGQPVYFAHEKIVSRLQLRHVPSIVAQKKRMMEVFEIDVDHQDKIRLNN